MDSGPDHRADVLMDVVLGGTDTAGLGHRSIGWTRGSDHVDLSLIQSCGSIMDLIMQI